MSNVVDSMSIIDTVLLQDSLATPLITLGVYKYVYTAYKSLYFEKEKGEKEKDQIKEMEWLYDEHFYKKLMLGATAYKLGEKLFGKGKIGTIFQDIKEWLQEDIGLKAMKGIIVSSFIACIVIVACVQYGYMELDPGGKGEYAYHLIKPIIVIVVIVVAFKVFVSLVAKLVKLAKTYFTFNNIVNTAYWKVLMFAKPYIVDEVRVGEENAAVRERDVDMFLQNLKNRSYASKLETANFDYKDIIEKLELKGQSDAAQATRELVSGENVVDQAYELINALKKVYKGNTTFARDIMHTIYQVDVKPMMEKASMLKSFAESASSIWDLRGLLRYGLYFVVIFSICIMVMNFKGLDIVSNSVVSWLGMTGLALYAVALLCIVIVVGVFAIEKGVFGWVKHIADKKEWPATRKYCMEMMFEYNFDATEMLDVKAWDTWKTVVKEFVMFLNQNYVLPFHIMFLLGIVVAIIYYAMNYENKGTNSETELESRRVRLRTIMTGMTLSLILVPSLYCVVYYTMNPSEAAPLPFYTLVYACIIVVVLALLVAFGKGGDDATNICVD